MVTAGGSFVVFMAQNIPLRISVCNRLHDTSSYVAFQIANTIADKPAFQLYKRRAAALRSPLRDRALRDSEKFCGLGRSEQAMRGGIG
jgi:hypothetical protein